MLPAILRKFRVLAERDHSSSPSTEVRSTKRTKLTLTTLSFKLTRHFILNCATYRNGTPSSGHFGNGNFSVDVDGSTDVEWKFFAELAVDVQNDAFAMNSKVNFVPFFIKDLNGTNKFNLSFKRVIHTKCGQRRK